MALPVLKRPLKIQEISFQRMTSVLNTVAIWTATVKVMTFSGSSTPSNSPARAKCPLELTGRYSVSPWKMPMMRACNQSMLCGFVGWGS